MFERAFGAAAKAFEARKDRLRLEKEARIWSTNVAKRLVELSTNSRHQLNIIVDNRGRYVLANIGEGEHERPFIVARPTPPRIKPMGVQVEMHLPSDYPGVNIDEGVPQTIV